MAVWMLVCRFQCCCFSLSRSIYTTLVQTATRGISIKCCTEIHVPQRMNTVDSGATSRSQVSLMLQSISMCTGWTDTKCGTDVQAHADFSSNADNRLMVCGFEGNVLLHGHIPLRMDCTKSDCGTTIRSNFN